MKASKILTVSKTLLTSGLMVVVFTSCNRTTDSTGSHAEESMIRSARELSNRAIEKRDTAVLASIWTLDYHVISSRNVELAGRMANRDRLQGEFISKPDILYVRTPSVINVNGGWNMASESGEWVGHWTEEGQLITLAGKYFAKWHKVDGRWMIRAEIFVPLKCSGGKICDQSPI